jgi:CheY-like chemotaxis protein
VAAKCLIIDDDALARQNYAQILKSMGHEYDMAANSKEGFKKIRNFSYDLVFLDIIMPDFTRRQSKKAGIKLLKLIKEQEPDLPVIIISALDKEQCDESLAEFEITGYIVKGDMSDDEIRKTITNALDNRNKGD